jgi:hypothetical protein
MWQTSEYLYPVNIAAVWLYLYYNSASLSRETKEFVLRLRFGLALGYFTSKLPVLLWAFDAPILIDETGWALWDVISTLSILTSYVATFTGSKAVRVLSFALMFGAMHGMLKDKNVVVWRGDCKALVDERLQKQDANWSYEVVNRAMNTMYFCNDTSRFIMERCDEVMFSPSKSRYRTRFLDMDYCGTRTAMLISEVCVEFLLLKTYQDDVKPAACRDVVIKDTLTNLVAYLVAWERCITEPRYYECEKQQQHYRDILQRDFNGTTPKPELHWMIEVERERTAIRMRDAENVSRSWQE